MIPDADSSLPHARREEIEWNAERIAEERQLEKRLADR